MKEFKREISYRLSITSSSCEFDGVISLLGDCCHLAYLLVQCIDWLACFLVLSLDIGFGNTQFLHTQSMPQLILHKVHYGACHTSHIEALAHMECGPFENDDWS